MCNFVSSADGKATAAGRTAPLAAPADRTVFHLLRTQVDALLAGTRTMRIERYGPPVRDLQLSQIRIAEGRSAQPFVVVISRSGDVPFDIPLFADVAVHVVLYVPADAEVPGCAAQVTRHELPAGETELIAVMRSLRRDHDVRSVLCEGGPILFNALLAQGLVDELFLTLSPALVGGGELGITAGPGRLSCRRCGWAGRWSTTAACSCGTSGLLDPARTALTPCPFESLQALGDRITRFLTGYQQSVPSRFAWTVTRQDLHALLDRR